jgi:hypothetical protein
MVASSQGESEGKESMDDSLYVCEKARVSNRSTIRRFGDAAHHSQGFATFYHTNRSRAIRNAPCALFLATMIAI